MSLTSIKLNLSQVPLYPESRGNQYFAVWYPLFNQELGAQGVTALQSADPHLVPGAFPAQPDNNDVGKQQEHDDFIALTGCENVAQFARQQRAAYNCLCCAFSSGRVDPISQEVSEGWPELYNEILQAGERGTYKSALQCVIKKVSGDLQAQALTIRRRIRNQFLQVNSDRTLTTAISQARTDCRRLKDLKESKASATWKADYGRLAWGWRPPGAVGGGPAG